MNVSEKLWHFYLRRPYKLYITKQGNPKNPAVVLLHGLAASSITWEPLIPLLKQQYYCITIDLVGFGASPKPQWYAYDMEDHVRAIRHAIKGLHLRKDYILIGHSLGSFIATRYARHWPQHIAQLILMSPPIYTPPQSKGGKFIARTRNNLLLKIYKFLRSHPRMTPENFARLSKILPLPRSVILDPDTWEPFRRSLERCIEQQSIREDLAVTPVPTDIFYGALDQVVVAYNIEQIPVPEGVTLHRVGGVNHDVSKRYARAVATKLLAS